MDAFSRREFMAQTAMAGAGLLLGVSPATARAYPANDKLSIGVIGVANRGRANLDGVASEHIAALCDVDETYLAACAKDYPQAALYTDFRKMIDKGGLDAVVISTADHTHAPAAAMALQADLDVYCEKPLAHTIAEVRKLTDLAGRRKRITQMGTQIHAESNYRRVVEAVQSGAIGEVREVHVWCGGGPAPAERPEDRPPVPESLHWDLWLGPAPSRPYHPAYVPFQWRWWWDFGNGTLGDMACHHMDLPFWALNLRVPDTIEAGGPPVHPERCPQWLVVRYEFGARSNLPPVTLTWYHGDRRPPYFTEGFLPEWGNGTLFVGSKGMLLADYSRHVLLPERRFRDWNPPPRAIPDSIGHHAEWIAGCKTRTPALCDFSYAGPLTEAVLLGNVAYRSGKTLHWDSVHMRLPGSEDAERYLRRRYRRGWRL